MLTVAMLAIEILSQFDKSTLKDFKPSCMSHGKGSVKENLTSVEYIRLTVSETVLKNEPSDGYKETI